MKDPLFTNKVAGAVLAAALLIFGLPQLTGAIFGGGGHHGGGHDELELAYCCVELETSGGHAVEAPAFDLGAALAEASIASGARRSALCQSCHTFEEGGANKAGPNLYNVVGRPLGSVAGFGYTAAVTGAGGDWTYERLDGYLKNSQEFMPGTAMVQRIARDNQRAELLAYLGSLSPNPIAFPAPRPVDVHEAEGGTDAEGIVGHVIEVGEEILDAAGELTGDAADAAEKVVNDIADEAAEAGASALDGAEEVAQEVEDTVGEH